MDGLQRLHHYAQQNRIQVYYGHIGFSAAVTIKDGNDFNIAIDVYHASNEQIETELLMHELAHVATGAFYCTGQSLYQKRKMENRAERWMVRMLVPRSELVAAIESGHETPWDLAEFFSVSEELLMKALIVYENNWA